MTYQGSIFRKSPGNLAREARRNARLRWAKVATLVAGGLLAGFVLQPALGRDVYATFYPVAPLCAWAMGPKPALGATLLSAAVAYLCLGPASAPLDAAALAALASYLAVSAGAVALVSGLALGVARSGGSVGRPSAAPRRSTPSVTPPAPERQPVVYARQEALAEPPRRRAIG